MTKSASKKASKTVVDNVIEPESISVPTTTITIEPIDNESCVMSPDVIPATAASAVEEPVKGKPAKAAKEKKVVPVKAKLVRDSFTFPETDYAQIAIIKQRALTAGREVKKSEVLRAGLAVLSALSEADLMSALDGIDRLKLGRPGN